MFNFCLRADELRRSTGRKRGTHDSNMVTSLAARGLARVLEDLVVVSPVFSRLWIVSIKRGFHSPSWW